MYKIQCIIFSIKVFLKNYDKEDEAPKGYLVSKIRQTGEVEGKTDK